MAGKSDYLENEILDHVIGASAYTAPATLYIGLATAAITDATTGSTVTEADYTGYARVSVTNNATNFPAASGGAKSNANEIAFPEKTGGADDVVTYAFVADAATLGNILYWAALSASKTIQDGDVPRFVAGDLDFSED